MSKDEIIEFCNRIGFMCSGRNELCYKSINLIFITFYPTFVAIHLPIISGDHIITHLVDKKTMKYYADEWIWNIEKGELQSYCNLFINRYKKKIIRLRKNSLAKDFNGTR